MRKRKYSHLKPESAEEMLGGSDSGPIPTVHNIVATSKIIGEGGAQYLELQKIHEMLPFSFYDQRKFAAITVWLHRPVCTTLLFSSGKLVVTGCRTWYQCVYASMIVAELLNDCIPGKCFSLQECDVQNVVGHVEIPMPAGQHLDLQAMHCEMALNCTYQKKMFPGLIYRPEASPVVLLCFYSGKIVITGGKTMEDVFNGWKRLWPTIKRFITVSRHTDGQYRNTPLDALALVRDTATDDPGGPRQGLVQCAGSGGGRKQQGNLRHSSELQGLGDELATEGPALSL
jgi:transcription initiation factor TFIID TATA-box-binding protein